MVAKKKPNFRRQDAHKKIRLASNWRKPNGSDSKMRVGFRGYLRIVKVGYGSTATTRGLNRNNMRDVIINNVSELGTLDPKKDSVIIASTVGSKKKLTIAEEAQKLKLMISNVKDVSKFIENCKSKKKADTESNLESKKKRVSKQEADKKASEKKKKEDEKKSAEEKKDTPEKAAEKASDRKKALDKTLITKK